jgi:hypothetical protein
VRVVRHQAAGVSSAAALCLWLGEVTGRYREWPVAASGQSGNDLAVFVFGGGPQGLGCNVAGTANRQGNLRGGGVVGASLIVTMS